MLIKLVNWADIFVHYTIKFLFAETRGFWIAHFDS